MKGRIASCVFAAVVAAAPAPDPTTAAAASYITSFPQFNSSLALASKSAATFASAYTSILSAIVPSAAPTNDAQFASVASSLYKAYPSDPLAAGGALLLSGLAGAANSIGNPADSFSVYGACNSYTNVNTRQPSRVIYPKAGSNDAPYDVSESSLRAAMYFPSGYTNGAVKPVLFIPGTGGEACEAYADNIAKLLTGSNIGDPVFVNIPANMLADEQVNSEYVAYAINYVAATTGRNDIAIVSWSGGGWTFKYWPSTRNYTSSFIALSPDFQGTILAPVLCPPGIPCAPSVLQQTYGSKYIAALRKNGGGNSYVPTTTIHDIFDEIVEPQQDPFASATMGKGLAPVTNVQVQDICSLGTIAAGPHFGHENVLYSPVTIPLIFDALKYGGAANVNRAGPYNCSQYMATGITYSDVFATEFLIPYAGFNIETYPNKILTEPAIKSYAS